MVTLLLFMGVANWFATLLVVESELFRPARTWVRKKQYRANRSLWFWRKATYLTACHMCAGTWIALAMAAFLPPVVPVPVIGWLLAALTIRGIGHLVLVLHKLGEAMAEDYRRDYREPVPRTSYHSAFNASDAEINAAASRWLRKHSGPMSG